MSTTLPFLSDLRGVDYGFVGCNAAEAASEVEPTTDAQCDLNQAAKGPAGAAAQSSQASSSNSKAVNSKAVKRPGATGESPQIHNRVAQVREQQGISQRTMARRLHIDLKSYQALERPETDLRISQLTALQAALDVPMVDLLEETQALSRPVAERAKMIKVMKTAAALRETPSNARVERMVQTLCGQLVDLMPELAEVSSWPQYGSRRGSSAIGKALAQQISIADLGFYE